MVFRIRTAAGLACCLLFAGVAAAQQRTTEVRQTTTGTTEVIKGTVVTGANVVVEGGATVGKVTDFVISDGGCIDYVVVSYNDRYVLVPWQVVHVNAGQHVVQVNVTQEKWREIPTFTGTNWPVTDQQYIQRVRTVFGTTESHFRGGRDADRRPLGDQPRTPADRQADRQDRRDNRTDRRDDRRDQRRDVENPNRPGDPNRPPDATRDPNRDRNRDRDRTPPPGSNPNTPPPANPNPPRTPPPPPPPVE
jgi:hypothetical protein